MLKRLLLGLVKGSLVGGALAYAMVAGLSLTSLTGVLAYVAVVAVGMTTAMIAGRPIWATGARIEVLLKAIAAALLSSGFLFLAGRYIAIEMDLGIAGSGKLVELPFLLLPTVATLLAVFFELDNDGSSSEDTNSERKPDQRVRVERSDQEESHSEEEAAEPLTRAERR